MFKLFSNSFSLFGIIVIDLAALLVVGVIAFIFYETAVAPYVSHVIETLTM